MIPSPFYAVITADIVASQTLSRQQLEQLQQQLAIYLAELAQRYQGNYQFYRGDGFQLVIAATSEVFRCAVCIRLLLRSLASDARLSLATGSITSDITDLATASGAALTAAGRGLDTIGQHRLTYHGDCCDHFALNIAFIDQKISSLTKRQAEALFIHLSEPQLNHAGIAKRLDSSRVNVTKLLNSAHYDLFDAFLRLASKVTQSQYKGV
ncbi:MULTISPECIES: hypothetical protein [unclassified Pseudoalteromonas]|uniref:hypothetical protein n=1 Tax=unclassified Pseudoalteromonas TaxID=194690 RepID=UPI003014DB7F